MGRITTGNNIYEPKCPECGVEMFENYCFEPLCDLAEAYSVQGSPEYCAAYRRRNIYESLIFKDKALIGTKYSEADRNAHMIIKMISDDFEEDEVLRLKIQSHFPRYDNTYTSIDTGTEKEIDDLIKSYTDVKLFNKTEYGYCTIWTPA